MSTELTPFAEVKQPLQDAGTTGGEPAGGLPDRTLGRLVGVTTWLAARRTGTGGFTAPRVVIVRGDSHGPIGTPMDDLAITEAIATAQHVGLRVVDVASREGDGQFHLIAGHPGPVATNVLSRAQAVAAVDIGRRLADAEIDAGADLLIPGLAGSGHDVVLGVLTAVLTGLEPVAAIPLADTDLSLWSAAVTDLRDALFRIRDKDKDAISLVTSVGGADIGALAGFLAQAAARRTPVLLDGLPVTVAAVLAHRLAPGAESWFLAAGEATGRAARRLQEMLGLTFVAAFETNSPTGGGALLVLPVIQAALGVVQPAPAVRLETYAPVSLTKGAVDNLTGD